MTPFYRYRIRPQRGKAALVAHGFFPGIPNLSGLPEMNLPGDFLPTEFAHDEVSALLHALRFVSKIKACCPQE
jgi:hypothetical protein